MSGQKITIEVHNREKNKAEDSKVKDEAKIKSDKRKDHYKKYVGLLKKESKSLSVNSYAAVKSLILVLMYLLVVLGDLLLMWNGNKNKNKNNSAGAQPKKNILDEGW